MRMTGGPRRLITAGGLLALLATAGEVAPGAIASAPTHQCGNKVITLTVAGNLGEPSRQFKITLKGITAQGVSCRSAGKFLELAGKGGPTPGHYTCRTGHFHAPRGYVPQVCTKPGVRIQYATQGG